MNYVFSATPIVQPVANMGIQRICRPMQMSALFRLARNNVGRKPVKEIHISWQLFDLRPFYGHQWVVRSK